jgi:hypothetical protein
MNFFNNCRSEEKSRNVRGRVAETMRNNGSGRGEEKRKERAVMMKKPEKGI